MITALEEVAHYPIALAFNGYAAVLALVTAIGDHLTDYFDPIDLGPLVLSRCRNGGNVDRGS